MSITFSKPVNAEEINPELSFPVPTKTGATKVSVKPGGKIAAKDTKPPKVKLVQKEAPQLTVVSIVIPLILADKINAEIIAAVKELIPTARTSQSSVNWYRNSLRKQGHSNVRSSRDILQQRARAKTAEVTANVTPGELAHTRGNIPGVA